MRTMMLVAIVAVCVGGRGDAPAQTVATRGMGDALADACREDVAAHCAAVRPGGGRLRECLQQHASELTPGCRQGLKEAIEQTRGGPQAWLRVCREDIRALCAGVAAGGGRIAACLRERRAALTPRCQASLPEQAAEISATPR